MRTASSTPTAVPRTARPTWVATFATRPGNRRASGGCRRRKLVTTEDVGNTAVYLLSDWSQSVTGEVVYVDAGWNIMGLTVPFEELE